MSEIIHGAMCVIAGRCLSGEQHATIIELKQQRDDAADSALDHASKYSNIVQAITDPENQPSQYGTVTLAMYNKLKQQRDELQRDAERYRWLTTATHEKGSPCACIYNGFASYRPISGVVLDEAIDAAIAKVKP